MSTTTSTNPSPANFADILNKLRNEYENDASVRSARNYDSVIKATDYFIDTYVRSNEARAAFEASAIEAATFGKKLIHLVSWSGRGPIYANQALSDLLDSGDLCARLQDWFNESYGEDQFRVFHYPIRSSRTTALTVSWDKAGFENADGILRSNRERAQQRLEQRHQHVENRQQNEEDDRPQRPRRREYDEPREQRTYQPRDEQREQRTYQPRDEQREQRTYQPRDEQREPREQRTYHPRTYHPRDNDEGQRSYQPRNNYQPRDQSSAPRTNSRQQFNQFNAGTQQTGASGASGDAGHGPAAAGEDRPRRRMNVKPREATE